MKTAQTGIVLFVGLLVSAIAIAASPEAFVESLRDDDVRLNAWSSFRRVADQRWNETARPLPEGVEPLLKAALSSDDYQQRQFATALLIRVYASRGQKLDEWPEAFFVNMIEGLGADDLNGFNAFGNASFYSGIYLRHAPALPEGEIRRLEAALGDLDHQRSQYAAWILMNLYEMLGVPVADRPESFYATLVAGLPHDTIQNPLAFNNHGEFLLYLHRLEERRPVKLVADLLGGEDAQGRYGAALLLARYRAGTVQPEVTAELLPHLRDDGIDRNEIAAFHGLVLLGEENARALLADADPKDWQEAGFLQCLAAYYDLSWSAPDRFLPEWYEMALEKPYAEMKLPSVALYLHPAGSAWMRGKDTPRFVEPLAANRRARTPREKALWAETRHGYLPNADGAYRTHGTKSMMWWSIGKVGGRGR